MGIVRWGLAMLVFAGALSCVQGQVSLGEGLDGVGLVWKTGSGSLLPSEADEPGWEGMDLSAAFDETDVARPLKSILQGQRPWLSAEVSGPGLLTFHWKVDGLDWGHRLGFSIEGYSVDDLRVEEFWQVCHVVLGEGTHHLRWEAEVGWGDVQLSSVLLDQVSFTPGATLPAAEAIEGAEIVVVSGPVETHWHVQTDEAYDDGGEALESGLLADEQRTSLRALFAGPGKLAFWAKVSSQADEDMFEFRLDGATTSWSGEEDWFFVEEVVDEPVWCSWQYRKNGSESGGQDRAWIDDVVFTPDWHAEMAEALDVESGDGIRALRADWLVTTSPEETHDGEDALTSASLTRAELRVGVKGPGVLRVWEKREGNVSSLSGHSVYSSTQLDRRLYDDEIDPPSWQETEIVVPPGDVAAYWRSFTDDGGVWRLDDLRWLPPVSVAEGLDSELTFTESDPAWVGLSSLQGEGEDYIASPLLGGERNEAWLETEVTGPVWLGYSWATTGDGFECRMDGHVVFAPESLYNRTGWQQAWLYVPAGSHQVRWAYRKGSYDYGASFEDARLDAIRLLSVGSSNDIAAALNLPGDLTGLGMTLHGASVEQRLQGLVSQDGSALQLEVGETLTMGFGQAGVLVWTQRDDNSSQAPLHTWTAEEQRVTSSNDVLSFRAYSDRLWLDQLQFLPAVPVEVFFDSELSFTSGGPSPVVGYPSPTDPVVRLGASPDPANPYEPVFEPGGWLETEVEGPGLLRYQAQALGGTAEIWAKPPQQSRYVSTGLRTFLDGEEAHLQFAIEPRSHAHAIPPGTHTVRWENTGLDASYPISGATLADIQMVPGIDLHEVLELDADYHLHLASEGVHAIDESAWLEGGSSLHWTDPMNSFEIDIAGGVIGTEALLVTFASRGGPVEAAPLFGAQHVSGGRQTIEKDGWSLHYLELPSERCTGLRISSEYFNNSGTTHIDTLSLSPSIALTEALDTDLTFTSSNARGYEGLLSEDRDFAVLGNYSQGWIETELEGPGTLSYLALRHDGNGELLINDEPVIEHGLPWSSAVWERHQVTLGSGSHTVRWNFESNSRGASLLDQITWTSITPGPLDWTGLALSVRGPWEEEADPFRVDETSLRIVPTSPIEASVRVSAVGRGLFRFWAEGSGVATLRGESFRYLEWPFASDTEGQGQWHYIPTLEWTTTLELAFTVSDEAGARLDALSWTPETASLEEGLEMDSETVTTSGEWFGVSNLGDAVDQDAVIGFVDGEGSALLETNISGPGVLSFRWRHAGDSGLDELLLNDEPFLTSWGNGQWQTVEVVLGDGEHKVGWRASSSYSWRKTSLWIDEVKLVSSGHPLDLFAPGSYATSQDGMQVNEDESYGITLPPGRVGYVKMIFDEAGLNGLSALSDGGESVYVRTAASTRVVALGETWQVVEFPIAESESVTATWADLNSTDQAQSFQLKDVFRESPMESPPTLEEWLEMEEGMEVLVGPSEDSWEVAAFPSSSYLYVNALDEGSGPAWIEIPANGAKAVSFEWRGQVEEASLLVDGQSYTSLPSGLTWTPVYVELPEDAITLRWEVTPLTAASTADLPSMRLIEWHDSRMLSESVDLEGQGAYGVTFGGGWEKQSEDTHDGNDALRWHPSEGNFQWHIPQAGLLTFWARVGGDNRRLLVSGGVPTLDIRVSSWERYQVYKSADEIIEFEGSLWPTDVGFVLDQFHFEPFQDINDVAHVTPLTLVSGGASVWQGVVSEDGYDDPNFLVSPKLESGGRAWVETNVTGPGLLEFAWNTSGQGSSSEFLFSVDGRSELLNRVPQDWRCHQRSIPEGEHTVRWEVGSTFGRAGVALLDHIRFIQGAPNFLSSGLDRETPFVASGLGLWEPSPDGLESDDAILLRVGDGAEVEAWLQTELEIVERSLVSWWVRTDGPPLDHSQMTFRGRYQWYDNGIVRIAETRPDGWQKHVTFLEPGSYESRLQLKGTLDGVSRIWLDRLEVTPLANVSLAEALDNETLEWRTNEEAPWRGEQNQFGLDGQDQAIATPISADPITWLETTVTGPTELHFTWSHTGQGSLSVDGTALQTSQGSLARDYYLLIPDGVHEVRWECLSGVHVLDLVQQVSPQAGISSALEWFPLTGAALAVSDRGGLSVVEQDGDHVLEVKGQTFTFHSSSLSAGYFGVEARRLVDRQDGFYWEPNISLQNEYLPAESLDWHLLTVPIPDSASVRLWVNGQSYSSQPHAHSQIARLREWTEEEIDLANALDTALPLLTDPEVPWRGVLGSDSADGMDHAAGGSVSATSFLETVVEGPGLLRFWSRGSLSWVVNGIPFASFGHPTVWGANQLALPEGSHTIRWQTARYASAGLDQISFVPDASITDFDSWALLHDLEGAEADPDADPNGDGISNRAAWAFGISPKRGLDAADEARLPGGAVMATPLGDCLEMEFYRRIGSDERYLPQFGDSPAGPWTTQGNDIEFEDLGNGWQRVRVRDRVTVAGEGRRFGRVEISD